MAGATISVDIRDFEDMREKLARLEDLGANPEPMLGEIGGSLETSTRLRFERGEAPDGTPWLTSIRVRREGGQTLVKSTRLRDSITHEVVGDTVEVGTNVIYAGIHQFGGEAGRKSRRVTIPARPYLGIDADDRREIGRIVDDHLSRALST